MKILTVEAINFGSYQSLEFNYDEQGLCLVSGPTGSGKSTLLDLVPWCLYGVTSKNISVDSVRSWGNRGDTSATCEVQLADETIRVCRVRGNGRSNDLWFESSDGQKHRGKDLKDTQKLLEQRLGVSAVQYLLGASFNELSASASFFTDSAKDRRELLNQLVDLTLACRLVGNGKIRMADARGSLLGCETRAATLIGKLGGIDQARGIAAGLQRQWDKKQAAKLQDLEEKANSFDEKKSKEIIRTQEALRNYDRENEETLRDLYREMDLFRAALLKLGPVEDALQLVKDKISAAAQVRCPECGGVGKHVEEHYRALESLQDQWRTQCELRSKLSQCSLDIASLEKSINPFVAMLRKVEDLENRYADDLHNARIELNPFTAQLSKLDGEATTLCREFKEVEKDITLQGNKIKQLEHLLELNAVFRSKLLEDAVSSIEIATNSRLERFFDSEFRVKFTSSEDKIDVEIFKGEHSCEYAQLSKGQRQLLKLCFATSVMDIAANNAGQHYNAILFDESLDGLDTDLKLKSYALFQDLSTRHSTVLVIDHSDALKNHYDKRYEVSIVDGTSSVSEV